ncbi:MAG: hypothetical protein F4205_04615 [Gemmatimonadetes bacterium]|nr:hypothetical protein [Chloroflexota bacterium]MYG34754.1 hypothetical protein [Gemmatimonadota bacterium]
MTTETAPDPIVRKWTDDLEEELVEAGMEAPQAKAYGRAFEVGMMRVMSVVATKDELLLAKQELRDSIAESADQLRREMNIHVAHFERRFSEFKRFMYGGAGLIIGGIITLIIRAFS